MTPEYWKELQDLFAKAADLPAEERAALLDRECHDAAMRAELESMLRHDTRGDRGLHEAIESAAREIAAEEDPWVGKLAGAYRIVEKIADGGMGSVYLGERADDQYRQRVAIKMLGVGLASASLKSRFLSERQILANLNHPNIAKLIDGGTTDNGVPYLVMEYIDGVPLDEYCDRERLTVPARLALLRDVCAAVQYAHRSLVIHRDIKPGNILVTADGVPKLLDFGIAKLLAGEEEAGQTVAATRADIRLLTPEYASPEQVTGNAITTATDVYALGVLTYRLLTGQSPYPLAGARSQDVYRAICTTEPERPSMAVVRADAEIVARNRSTTPTRLRKQLRGDLDNIVLTAMRKEPERRYGTARSMSEDLKRYLDDLPVHARAASFGYLAGKFITRYRYRVAIACAGIVGIIGVAGFYTWRLAEERDLVVQERDAAEATADFLVGLFEQSDPQVARGRTISARELLDRGAEDVKGRFADEPSLRARLMQTLGQVYFNLGQYDEADGFAAQIASDLESSAEGSRLPLADALVLRGNIAAARNDFETSERYFDRGLAIYRQESGPGSQRTLETLVAIGQMQYHYGGTAAAISSCEQADALLTRSGADVERATLAARAKICRGRAYLVSARPEDARQVLEEARAILVELYGENHPDVADAEHELGAVDHFLGHYEDAIAHYERSLAIKRRVLGNRHTSLAEPLTELADVSELIGDNAAAESHVDEALDILRAQFGDDHTLVGIALHIKGNILLDQGRNSEAEQLLRRSLAIMERLLDPSHENIPMVENALASALEFQGKFDEAEQHYRRAIRLSEQHQGSEYLDTIIHLSNLGSMLAAKGDYEAALPVMEEAVRRGTAIVGSDHPDVVIFNHAYGKVLGYLGRYDEAAAILDKVGEDYRRIYGEEHYRYANLTSDRGALCLSMGDLDCAAKRLAKARELKEKAVGTGHNSYAQTLYETARLKRALGDADEARNLAEQALSIFAANRLPEAHINVVRARELLASLQAAD